MKCKINSGFDTQRTNNTVQPAGLPRPAGRQFYITFYEALDENNKRENGMLIKLILKRKHKKKIYFSV